MMNTKLPAVVLPPYIYHLSIRKSLSRVGGYHYLSSPTKNKILLPIETPPMDGPIHAVCNILRNVMESAAQEEVGGLFGNRQEATILGTILEELDQPQPPTPIKTDNSTAAVIANKIIRQSKSKPMDMRFYWIQDRVKQ